MRRLFDLSQPQVLALLVGLALLLRLPSLLPGFTATDEAFYWLNGQRLWQGHLPYQGAWEKHPPLLYLLHGLAAPLGTAGLVAIRVLAAVLVGWTAWLLCQVLWAYRYTAPTDVRPGVWYALAMATPWYAQELNAELLINAMGVSAVALMLQASLREGRRWPLLAQAGILAGLAILTKYQGALVLGVLLVGAPLVLPLRRQELGALVLGCLGVLWVAGMAMAALGLLGPFWQLGWLANWDYLRLGGNPGENPTLAAGLLEYLKHWGPWLAVGLVTWLGFRLGRTPTTSQEKRLETVLSVWLMLALGAVALGGSRLYLHYGWLLLPPLLLYVGVAYGRLRWPRVLRLGVPTLAWGWYAALLAVWVALQVPSLNNALLPHTRPGGWVASLQQQIQPTPYQLAARQALEVARAPTQPRTGWVLGFWPEGYRRLGLQPGVPYLNHTLAHHRMPWLQAQPPARQPWAGTVDPLAVHHTLERERPTVLVDLVGWVPRLQARLPTALAPYRQLHLPQHAGGQPPFVLYVRQHGPAHMPNRPPAHPAP